MRVVIEVDTLLFRQRTQVIDPTFFVARDLEGVEELRVLLVVAVSLEHLAQIDGFAVNAFGDLADTFCAVIDAVHTGHHRREGFGRTDIRGRAFALDMLFARLQGETVGGVLVFIFAQTDDTSRHVAFVLVARRHVAGCRTAKAHRQTKTLRGAAHDIRVKRFEQHERHQVSYYRHLQSCLVAVVDEGLIILDRAVAVGPLYECAEELCGRLEVRVVAGDDLDVLACRAGTQYR